MAESRAPRQCRQIMNKAKKRDASSLDGDLAGPRADLLRACAVPPEGTDWSV